MWAVRIQLIGAIIWALITLYLGLMSLKDPKKVLAFRGLFSKQMSVKEVEENYEPNDFILIRIVGIFILFIHLMLIYYIWSLIR